MTSLWGALKSLHPKKCFLCSKAKTIYEHEDNNHHICDRCFKRLVYLGQLDTVIMDDRDVVKVVWEPRFSKK